MRARRVEARILVVVAGLVLKIEKNGIGLDWIGLDWIGLEGWLSE
jgi:hypothetical protein